MDTPPVIVVPQPVPPKPGWQTTEFWLTILTNVASILLMVADVLPPKYGVPAMAVGNSIYAVARAMTKHASPPPPVPPPGGP